MATSERAGRDRDHLSARNRSVSRPLRSGHARALRRGTEGRHPSAGEPHRRARERQAGEGRLGTGGSTARRQAAITRRAPVRHARRGADEEGRSEAGQDPTRDGDAHGSWKPRPRGVWQRARRRDREEDRRGEEELAEGVKDDPVARVRERARIENGGSMRTHFLLPLLLPLAAFLGSCSEDEDLAVKPDRIFTGIIPNQEEPKTPYQSPATAYTPDKMSWSITDRSIASVEVFDSGGHVLLTALKPGRTTLRASANGKSKDIPVTVTEYSQADF